MQFAKARIVENIHPAPGYAYLRFAGDRPFAGEPGQFAMVRGDFGGDPILPRAFSLVETGETGAVLVRVVGKATRRLADMRVDDLLFVLGPLGNTFETPKKRTRPMLVAGGVGVAPLVFLAERLSAGGIRPAFVYGGRKASDILFRERISRSSDLVVATEDGSLGEKGLVTGPVTRMLGDEDFKEMCACGPHPMMEALAETAMRAGVRLQVSLEQAMACGMGTCKGCAVHAKDGRYRYVCSDGPVFDARVVFGGER